MSELRIFQALRPVIYRVYDEYSKHCLFDANGRGEWHRAKGEYMDILVKITFAFPLIQSEFCLNFSNSYI